MLTGLIKMYSAHTAGKRLIAAFICILLSVCPAFAAGKTVAGEENFISNPLFIALLVIVIVLGIMIVIFTEVVKAGAFMRGQKEKTAKDHSQILKVIAVCIAIKGFSGALFAQAAEKKTESIFPDDYMGLNAIVFYIMIIVIIVELIALWMIYRYSMQLMGVTEYKLRVAEEKAKVKLHKPSLIEKLNASVALEEEADIMLDHNYDGIRELDNDLPPWWKYGFYLTIVVAAVYLVHYHVTNTGQLQLQEYEQQLADGKRDVDEYMKKAANLVDENNVTQLTDEASLAAGKLTFVANCSACHGQAGEGNAVGPNLTDDYWLHKGSIKDVFRSVKYGWPEKGMKSWQQDLGAKQIHQVSSYIKSLQGSNPANAKEKQGELYLEEKEGTVPGVDSAQLVRGAEVR